MESTTSETPTASGRKTVCVFCSASNAIAPVYRQATHDLGICLAERGYDLVYGGTQNGLMGEVANGVHERGGKVTGILSAQFEQYASGEDVCLVTDNLHERKYAMDAHTGAGFIIAPGGFGSLDEFATIVALNQAERFVHTDSLFPPVVLFNVRDYYRPLLAYIDHMVNQGFARAEDKSLYTVVSTPQAAVDTIDAFVVEARRLPERVRALKYALPIQTRPCRPAKSSP